MKFNFKSRGFVVVALSAMLIVIGVVNYELSKQSALSVSNEFKAYEQAQSDKNSKKKNDKKETKETAEITIVDSKENENTKVKEKLTETSKEIEEQLTSKENMSKSTYILDMKMTREKQRNNLSDELNEIINNPSTSDTSREEASNMKVKLVKYQETELKIENLLSAKGYEDALVYIGEENINVVVNKDLSKSDAAKIFDLVAQQTGSKYENIKLTPIKN